MIRGIAITPLVPTLRSDVEIDASGATLVDIKGDVNADLLSAVRSLGGEVITSLPEFHAIRARMPISRLEVLAARNDVREIMQAEFPEDQGAGDTSAIRNARAERYMSRLMESDGTGKKL